MITFKEYLKDDRLNEKQLYNIGRFDENEIPTYNSEFQKELGNINGNVIYQSTFF